MHKLFHIQHYLDGSPHAYFSANEGNQPVVSGGIKQYSTYIELYAAGRCYDTYYCHDDTIWRISTVTAAFQTGGIFDGNWHCLEWRVKRNSAINTADGLIEVWLDGTKLTYLDGYPNTGYNFTETGSDLRGWAYASIGGNTNNVFDTSCANTADCEQWYAMDDVVISTTYVGTDYVIGSSATFTGVILNGVQ
jgi:hypothetical protein